MKRHWAILLFLLGSGAVFLVFLFDRGFIAKGQQELQVSAKSDDVLTAFLHHPPKVLRVRQDGLLLRGPFPAVSDLKAAGEGAYSGKGNRVYIRSMSGLPAEFTFEELHEVPDWCQGVFSILAAVGMMGMLAQGAGMAASPPAGQKMRPLDGLRGCACIVVVCFHFCIAFLLREPLHAEDMKALLKPFPYGILVPGSFCVQVFFVLSGFVLSLPFFRIEKEAFQAKLRSAFIRRPFRLLGVMLPVLVLAHLLGYGPQADPFTVTLDLITSPFAHAVNYVTPLWTLKTELYGSLGLFVCLWLLLGARRVWHVCFYAGALVLLRGTDYLGFVMGAAFAEATAMGTLPLRGRVSVWLTSAGVVVSLWLAAFSQELLLKRGLDNAVLDALNGWFPLSVVEASCLVFGTLHLVRLQQFLTLKPIQFLGHISYSLYAIHWLVLYSIAVPFALWLEKQRGWEAGVAWSLAGLVCLVSVIVLAWLVTLGIDTPAIRWSRRIADCVLERERARESTHNMEALGETAASRMPS